MKSLEVIRREVSQFRFSDYLRHLKSVEEACSDGKPLRVAILRSYTAEPMEPVLRLRLLLDGFRPEIWMGGYNQYVTEILDQNSTLYQFRPDLVLLMTRVEELLPQFVEEYAARPPAEWMESIESKVSEFVRLAEQIESTLSAQVIVQNMTIPWGQYFGINDAQHSDGQTYLVSRFNRRLVEKFEKNNKVYVWDYDRFVRAKGYENLYDAKTWYVSRNPFKQSSYPVIVDDLNTYIRSALGHFKKCVVVDLDNTLWGGIVGEDGFEGISLGQDYPGNCFRDFQKELLKLYHRGILLAINSKNNERDAFDVIDNHPDMILRRKHFAAHQINWRDKASNMRALATELNIGIDSMIFIDDNPRECDLVRQQCPDCLVLHLPDKAYLLPRFLDTVPGLERISLTDEDKRRGDMYQAQRMRGQSAASFHNLEDYWSSLGLEVHIEPASAFSIPRIAQLTQRTNQMNLTTRRYTEAEVEALEKDPQWTVVSVSAKDKYGDHGIVGAMFMKSSDETCHIDTFLMSCRVLGLNIEQYMIAYAAAIARSAHAKELIGEYIPTAKNKVAANMYQKLGFGKLGETTYVADLNTTALGAPKHIKPDIESFLPAR